ncbi:hypothetical protein SUGI_0065340 [Cryptomeria japonica]|nr:hypothetical protein SUGI_0065340 [Cryptomeria japonica]
MICVGNAQTSMEQKNEQPGIHSQHANLLLEDTTSSESPWTNEKHSLHLNSMEEAFVSRLYTYPLNEEVESGFSNGQELFGFAESEPEKPSLYHDVQNNSKECGLKEKCSSNDTIQENDRNGRRKKRKLQHPNREITDVFEEVQSKYNDEHARNFFAGRNRLTEDTTVSETSVKTLSDNQEDQSTPLNNETSPKEDGKP